MTKENDRILEIQQEVLGRPLWRTLFGRVLWTCREGEYAVNEYDRKFKDMIWCSY